MVQRKRIVYAGMLILSALAGCASYDVSSFFLLQSDASGHERVVAGSLDSVAESAQATLTRLGFSATMTKQAESIRILSKTSTGTKFTLVLTREKTKEGEKTRVRIEWDGGSSEQISFQLLSELEAIRAR